MTSVLTMRLDAPMQHWGSYPLPTVTGINGMLAAAVGVPRGEEFSPGYDDALLVSSRPFDTFIGTDFRTRDAGKERSIQRSTMITGAEFIVLLSGPDQRMSQLHEALSHPEWALFFGQKSAVPTVDFLHDDALQVDGDLYALAEQAADPHSHAVIYRADFQRGVFS